MPKLSLLSASRRWKNHFEVAIGYSIPIQDKGNLNFIQQGYDDSDGGVSHVIPGPDILSHLLSVTYNNKPLTRPIYRYGRVYLELRFDVLGSYKF